MKESQLNSLWLLYEKKSIDQTRFQQLVDKMGRDNKKQCKLLKYQLKTLHCTVNIIISIRCVENMSLAHVEGDNPSGSFKPWLISAISLPAGDR